ncbi:hypothetical protein [Streptomyces sp. NPDC005533]|uniref:hypothetical protein n=1 Tax=Streptomyces sp. NPDC005533 TaxID=3364723 RepID=UPI00368C1BE5
MTLAVISLGALPLAPAASASNARVLSGVTCAAGVVTVTFSPGITFTPREVNFELTGNLTGCISSSAPYLRNGSFTAEGHGTFSCTAIDTTFDQTIEWKNLQGTPVSQSKASGTTTIALNPAGNSVYLSEGSVYDGEFTGHDYSSEGVTLTTQGLCADEDGVTETTGTTTAIIS